LVGTLTEKTSLYVDDEDCENGVCSLTDCFSKYAIIRFKDIHGNPQTVFDPNTKLSDKVSIEYQIFQYPWHNDYKIIMAHDIGFTKSVKTILFLVSSIFVISGGTGYWFAVPRKRFKLKLRY
jgi:hypothetical protein